MNYYLLSQHLEFTFKDGTKKEGFTSQIITAEDLKLTVKDLSNMELFTIQEYMKAHDIKDEDIENLDVQLLSFTNLGSHFMDKEENEDHE